MTSDEVRPDCAPPDDAPPEFAPPDYDLVCCSLEPWDQIWRRNQLLVTELLRLRPHMRILFAELPVDISYSLSRRQLPRRSKLRVEGDTGRLWTMAPRKLLPRRLWRGVDRSLSRQVAAASRSLGLTNPLLWINDVTYVDLPAISGRPCIYDVTDDWTMATATDRESERQRRNDGLMLEQAVEVVVCSPSLVASRGARRQVHLVPNGVDVAHFRTLQPRPADMPEGRIVVYHGSLNEGRLDIDLCVEIGERLAGRARLVLIGPDSFGANSSQRLGRAGVVILGPRAYSDLPAYLQRADALVVPHSITPFTESLDPIKAREIQALGRPTLTTPVAGFRDLGPPVRTAPAAVFVDTLLEMLDDEPLPPGPGPLLASPPTWADRADEFLAVLDAAVEKAPRPARAQVVRPLPRRREPDRVVTGTNAAVEGL